MMRCGKTLGTLDWETNTIYLMRSVEPETDEEFLKEVKEGKFIVKRK